VAKKLTQKKAKPAEKKTVKKAAPAKKAAPKNPLHPRNLQSQNYLSHEHSVIDFCKTIMYFNQM
jgi:hypothetical protein